MTRTAEIKDTEPKIATTISLVWSALACLSLMETGLELLLPTQQKPGKRGRGATTYVRHHDEFKQRRLEIPLEAQESCPVLDSYLAGAKINAGEVLSRSIQMFDLLEPRIESTLNTVGGWLKQFGRFMPYRSYSYMLWFDLRDSKANHPEPETSSDARSQLVREFKGALNHELRNCERNALKDNVELFFWNGTKDSTNDEKHIFATGAESLGHLLAVVAKLGDLLAVHRTMFCRAALVPCNFMGSEVIRFGEQEEVMGPAFFEHWSCLKTEFSAKDKANPGRFSRLLVVTEQLARKLNGFSRIDIAAGDRYEGTSQVHGRKTTTPVWFSRFR